MKSHRPRLVRALRALSLALFLATASAPLALARQEAPPDPTQNEIPLPCGAGWCASLVLDNGKTGIWTVKSYDVFPEHGCPEVVGLDDLGHCWILVSYSGKWTPMRTIEEKKWLGGLTHGDVDPRIAGKEVYTGGLLGNLYQVVTYAPGITDHRLIARYEAKELHTLLSGDLDPRTAGEEVLVFTSPGALYRVTPSGPNGTFESELLEELPGRVRDAIVLPAPPGAPAEIVTVARSGQVALLRIDAAGTHWSTIHASPMGKGRVAIAPARPGAPTVLYTVQDDGIVLRHERKTLDAWRTETIYLGPQGMRGIAAGRFDADPDVETLAVFGYSKQVELLSRRDGAWSAQTIFEDRDKGHWLAVAELDGRNSTDELVGSGYGGRIFQLSRPPGYGLDGVPAAAPPLPAAKQAHGAPRVAVQASRESVARIDPLSYGGGFEPKTLVYETLVRRDDEGRIVPALADSWRIEEGGRTYVFHLRPGARFHDGAPVDAEAVRLHFRRWVGLPEHGWLGASELIRDVIASASDELTIRLERPYALLPDLCAINPCSVRGPGAVDRNGRYTGPVGSGPFRFVAADDEGRVIRLRTAETDGAQELELVCFDAGDARAPIDALAAYELDLVFDGWYENVPRGRLAELARDPALALSESPGSAVCYLSFRFDAGPTRELALRRRVQSAIDRDALVRRVEQGAADPCRTWAAPSVAIWPAASDAPRAVVGGERVELVLVVAEGDARHVALAQELAVQLGRASLAVHVRALAPKELAAALHAGDFDLRLEQTWGAPYDPDLSLRARFLAPPPSPSAVTERDFGVDPELRRLVEEASAVADEGERRAIHARIQRRIDEAASVVPLYVPRRIAVARRGTPLPELGSDLYHTDLAGWVRAVASSTGR